MDVHDQLRSRPETGINVTPLIDVCLVLLIIFMVITPMLRDERLPAARDPAEIRRTASQVVLGVDAHGRLRLAGRGDEPESAGSIGERLALLHAGDADVSVLIRGDRDVAYGAVRRAMGLCAAAGFGSVRLLAEREPPQAQPGPRP